MDDVVLILEAAESAPPELANAMVEACSAAAVKGRCVFANTSNAPRDTPRASVVWDPDHLVAKLSLVVRGVASERSLRFLPQDPPVERWRSIGLVAATLVGEAERVSDREAAAHPMSVQPEKPAVVTTPSVKRSPPLVPKPPFERLVLDVAVLVGNGLERGGPRAGALARIGLLVPRTPLLLHVDTSFTVRPTDARGLLARWVTVGGGIGIRGAVLDRSLAVEGRLQGLAAWSGASVTDAGTGDSGGRVEPGIGAGVEIAWMFSEMIGLDLGVDGDLVPSGTVFRVRGSSFGRSTPAHVAGYVGIRLGIL